MKAGDVLKFVCDKLNLKELPDGGFEEGTPDNEAKGILTTWMATPEALRYAVNNGLNLVVCHEPLYWHENEDPPLYRCPGSYNKPLDWEKHPNNAIRKIVVDANLTVLRIHFGIDRLYIYDVFAEAMELGKVVAGDVYEKVYELPERMKLHELVEHIRDKTGLSSIRYVGDKMKIIEKVGNCWGGVGLSVNQYYARRTFQNGAQAIICGEMDEFAMFFAKQCGAALIETSHAVSENFGIKFFSDKLAVEFSPVPVEFYEVKVPYQVYGK